jgi:hypothetical protein
MGYGENPRCQCRGDPCGRPWRPWRLGCEHKPPDANTVTHVVAVLGAVVALGVVAVLGATVVPGVTARVAPTDGIAAVMVIPDNRPLGEGLGYISFV